ncbi:MAG: hypothetical protein ABSF26_24975 [Thermoguttaceae bacterium]
MGRFWIVAVAAACTAAGSGCLAPPRLLHPGTEKQQQARAQRFEPYPEPDTGPPIVGARPPDYQYPRAEVLRVQPRLGEWPGQPCPAPPDGAVQPSLPPQ